MSRSRPLILLLLAAACPWAISRMPFPYLSDPSLALDPQRFRGDPHVLMDGRRYRVGPPLSLDSALASLNKKGWVDIRITLPDGRVVRSRRISAFQGGVVADGDTLAFEEIGALQVRGPFRFGNLLGGMLLFGSGTATYGLFHDLGELVADEDRTPDKTLVWSVPGLLIGSYFGFHARDRFELAIQGPSARKPSEAEESGDEEGEP